MGRCIVWALVVHCVAMHRFGWDSSVRYGSLCRSGDSLRMRHLASRSADHTLYAAHMTRFARGDNFRHPGAQQPGTTLLLYAPASSTPPVAQPSQTIQSLSSILSRHQLPHQPARNNLPCEPRSPLRPSESKLSHYQQTVDFGHGRGSTCPQLVC